MNDNENIEINLDDDNENIDIDREDSIYTNISEEEINEIRSRIEANEDNIVVLQNESGNKVALSINSNYVMTLKLLNKANEVLSTGTIDLPIESMVVNASYRNGILTLTLQNGQTLDVDISDIVSGLVSETTFNSAVSRLEGLISGLDTRMTTAEEDIDTLENDVSDIKTEQTQQNTNIQTNRTNIATNTQDITNIKAEQTTQNNRIRINETDISTIKQEQTTQNTKIQKNETDISEIKAEQATQNTNIEKNITDIATNKASIETIQTEQVEQNENIEINTIDIENFSSELDDEDTAIGEDITLTNSMRYRFTKFIIGGKSEQNGTPTPESEVPIQNITDNAKAKVENRNLLNMSALVQGIYNSSSSAPTMPPVLGSINDKRYRSFSGTLNAGTYTICFDKANSILRDFTNNDYSSNNTMGIGVNNITNATFTIAEKSTIYISFRKYDGTDWDNSDLVWLVSGSTVTDYEPHEEQTVTFPLEEGQVLHEEDIITDKIVQNRITRLLNGQESSWTYYSANADWARPYLNLGNKKIGDDNTVANVLSNKFAPISWQQGQNGAYANYGVFSYSGDNRISFLIPKSELSSLDSEGVKQYFANNPTIIEYNLANPIETEFTQAQAQAKKEIDKLYSYKNITHITSDNTLSPTFDITYKTNANSREKLEEKIADLQEQVDMASDLIPTGDESGSDITVNDSAWYRFKKIVPGGKSEQESYTGKNKLNVLSQYTITQADDLKRKLHIEPNVTYKITFDNLEKGGNNNPSIIINGTVVIPVTNNRTFSITEEMTSANIYSNGSSYAGSEGITSTITNFMISEEGGAYEPYTGGQPAPNPNYECPIRNVGDNVNLFNEDTVSFVSGILDDNGNPTGSTTSHYTVDFYKIKPNTQYTLAGTLGLGNTATRLYFYNKDKEWISRTEGFTTNKITFTTPNNCYFIKIQVINEITLKTSDVILAEGISTSYRPYNRGNVEVKVENKNKYYTPNTGSKTVYSVTLSYNSNSSEILINGTATATISDSFSIEPIILEAGTYTASTIGLNVISTNADRIFLKNNDTSDIIVNSIKDATPQTFTLTETTNVVPVFIVASGSVYSNKKIKIQIEEGLTATDYIEHEEQTVNFPLTEGQVLHEGDTIEDKIVQRRKTITLTGNEDLGRNAEYSDRFSFIVKGYENTIDTNNLTDIYCNIATASLGNEMNTIRISSTGIIVITVQSNFSEYTVVAIKNKVRELYEAGTPIIIEIPLATPIETEFTTAQTKAKAQIDKLYSYKGTTHITSNANLDVTYRKDPSISEENTKSEIERIKARLVLLEE